MRREAYFGSFVSIIFGDLIKLKSALKLEGEYNYYIKGLLFAREFSFNLTEY